MNLARQKANKLGNRAEWWAGLYFQCRGYRLVKTRYKTRVGEIDLILSRGKSLVFLEVKARRSLTEALASIHKNNRYRIERAALSFIADYPQYASYGMRFDCIGLVFYRNFFPIRFVHLDNAWLVGS